MLRRHYFLAASLPPISLKEPPAITFEEFVLRLGDNAAQGELQQAQVLRRFVDVNNLRALWEEEEVDLRGNLSEKELDEALVTQSALPEYVFDFVGQFEKTTDRLKNMSGLLARFFAEEIPLQQGFLRKYLTFEREWRLVALALRAKQLGRDVTYELQFEDLTDPLVAGILAQRDHASYDPPQEYAEVKEILTSSSEDPMERHRIFAEWRFRTIEEMAGTEPFSFDQVLGYMAQLMLVEDWMELDKERGKMILDTFTTG